MSTARLCTVSFTDVEGITHSADVSASSLFEAAVLGLAAFRTRGLAAAVPPPNARLTITVREPDVRHELHASRVEAWLNSNGKSPKEQALKVQLRALLCG